MAPPGVVSGVVQVGDEQSDERPFKKHARRGCLLSLMLFNVVEQKIMRLVEEDMGVLLERKKIMDPSVGI